MPKPQSKNEYLSLILLVTVFVFSGLTAAKLVGYAMNGNPSHYANGENSNTEESSAEILKNYQEQNKELAGALKKKNLFYAPPKPPGPPTVCQAVFGDEAYIQYEGKFKWYKVGDKIGEQGKVTGIEATYVKVDWKGEEKKLAPIAVVESSRPEPTGTEPSVPKGPKVPSTGMKPVEKKGQGTVAKTTSSGGEDFSWLGVELSPELQGKLERMWAMIPDEMKEQAKQRWLNMTDEQKEEALKELENMPDNIEEMMEERRRR